MEEKFLEGHIPIGSSLGQLASGERETADGFLLISERGGKYAVGRMLLFARTAQTVSGAHRKTLERHRM